MKKLGFFQLRLLVAWLIFFTFQRILFVVHFFPEFKDVFSELALVPINALRLDLSGYAYLMSFAFLISCFSFFIRSEKNLLRLNRFFFVYLWIIIVLTSIITSAEIVSYYEWQTKLSSKIWIHFTTPSEIFRTSSGAYTWWFLLYLILQLFFAWLLFKKLNKKLRLETVDYSGYSRWLFGALYFVMGSLLFVLGFRGGWQKIPISATDAYYSDSRIVRDVTVNPAWNFINMSYATFKVDLDQYFNRLDPTLAEKIKDEVYFVEYPDSTIQVLDTLRPNIIMITLESWSAQMIEPLGGEKNITPNFNRICGEGLLFTEIYATSGTSETGHSSIMSGYPTISGISISEESAKCRKLPSINKELQKLGYSSFYTFGGSLSYGNIGGYLADVGFERLVDENDLVLEPKGQLGIHDEAMFQYFLSEVKNAKRPYFYGMFSQSTHAPYDMPWPKFDGYEGDEFVTSMNYADFHLGKFLEEIKKLPDFENTLVIILADHGKTNIINDDTYKEEFFHIPLLFWGGALKQEFQGKKIDKIGSQSDIVKTVLSQMKINSDDFYWSKDLLNPYSPEWAICTSTLSYGWKDSSGYTVYQMIEDRLIYSAYTDPQKTEEALQKCRAVLECMYREFKQL